MTKPLSMRLSGMSAEKTKENLERRIKCCEDKAVFQKLQEELKKVEKYLSK